MAKRIIQHNKPSVCKMNKEFSLFLDSTKEFEDGEIIEQTLGNEKFTHNKSCEYNQAIGRYRKEKDIAEEVIGMERAYGNMGYVAHNKIGQYQEAIDCCRIFLEIAEEMGEKKGLGAVCRNMELVHANMGFAHNEIGQYQEAIDCFRKSLKIAEDMGEKKRMEAAYRNMGFAHNENGQYEEAID